METESTKIETQRDANRSDGERVLRYYRKALDYQTTDPAAALNQARKAAEAVCRHIWIKKLQLNPDRPSLETLLGKLNSAGLLPQIILLNLNTIQSFGNFGGHDQGRESDDITADHIQPCIIALSNLVAWFLDVYHPDAKVTRNAAMPGSSQHAQEPDGGPVAQSAMPSLAAPVDSKEPLKPSAGQVADLDTASQPVATSEARAYVERAKENQNTATAAGRSPEKPPCENIIELYREARSPSSNKCLVAMIQAGITAEAICTHIFFQATQSPPQANTLEALLKLLKDKEKEPKYKGKKLLPPYVEMHIRTIQARRNYAAHFQGHKSPPPSQTDADFVINSLSVVKDWFLRECCPDGEFISNHSPAIRSERQANTPESASPEPLPRPGTADPPDSGDSADGKNETALLRSASEGPGDRQDLTPVPAVPEGEPVALSATSYHSAPGGPKDALEQGDGKIHEPQIGTQRPGALSLLASRLRGNWGQVLPFALFAKPQSVLPPRHHLWRNHAILLILMCLALAILAASMLRWYPFGSEHIPTYDDVLNNPKARQPGSRP